MQVIAGWAGKQAFYPLPFLFSFSFLSLSLSFFFSKIHPPEESMCPRSEEPPRSEERGVSESPPAPPMRRRRRRKLPTGSSSSSSSSSKRRCVRDAHSVMPPTEESANRSTSRSSRSVSTSMSSARRPMLRLRGGGPPSGAGAGAGTGVAAAAAAAAPSSSSSSSRPSSPPSPRPSSAAAARPPPRARPPPPPPRPHTSTTRAPGVGTGAGSATGTGRTSGTGEGCDDEREQQRTPLLGTPIAPQQQQQQQQQQPPQRPGGRPTSTSAGATSRLGGGSATSTSSAAAEGASGGAGDREAAGHDRQQEEQQVEEPERHPAILNVRCPVPPPQSNLPMMPAAPAASHESYAASSSSSNLRRRKSSCGRQTQPHPSSASVNNTAHGYSSSSMSASSRPRDGPIVQVLVSPAEMTERTLGRCIVQATGIGIVPLTADGGSWGSQHWDSLGYDPYAHYGAGIATAFNDEAPLAGLFRQRDGLFLPLSHVLAHSHSLEGEILSITRPVLRPRPPPPPTPIWPYIAAAIVVSYIAIHYCVLSYIAWDRILDATMHYVEWSVMGLINIPVKLFDVLVELPLKESYRYGPSFIGWEGQPLERICAQLTGIEQFDETFFLRNRAECERIYLAKEAAALQIRKPILYLFVAAVLFFAVKSLVKTYALRRHYRPDTNMVQVYNAINVLFRQFQRGGMPSRR